MIVSVSSVSKSLGFFLACILFTISVLAQQNLLDNPSFEEYKKTRSDILSVGELVRAWEEVAVGEVMYLNHQLRHAKPLMNPYGKQAPRTGKGMVVLKYTADPSHGIGDMRHYYLQTALRQPLKAGKKYVLEYWVSLAENSGLCTQEFSAYFFDQRIVGEKKNKKGVRAYPKEKSSTGIALDLLEMVAITKLYYRQGFIEDKENWTKIRYEFEADGREKYLVLGDFGKRGREVKKIPHHLKFHYHDAYYFIDDIALTSIEEKEETNDTVPILATTQTIRDVLLTKQQIVLPHVLFDHNHTALSAAARQQLDSVVKVLAQHKDWEVEIQGHTDNQGDSLYNLNLSSLRAKAVVRYLTEQGIGTTRTSAQGFGSQFPIMPNTTSEGRRRNRRVVIKLKKTKRG